MKKRYSLLIISILLISSAAFAQPANDNLCSAIAISANAGCTSGTNAGATNVHSSPTCWLTAANNDVWYSFVATTADMTISTDFAGGSLTDTQLALYSSSDNTCSGTLTQVGCDDDGGTSCNFCSIITATSLVVGNTYFIRVDGYSTNTGTFCIAAYDTPLANELTGTSCATATIVYPNSLACDNINGNVAYNYHSSTSTGGPTPLVGTNYAGCDTETNQFGGWSTFTANATTSTITNLTSGSNAATHEYTVFTGTCSALSAVNCYSVAKGASTSFSTSVGTQYYVLTTLPSSSTAGFRSDHCITSAAACTPPANDNCAGAMVVTANTAYSVTNACATADGTLCVGSNENNIWFSWTAPAGWGGSTYFQLYDQNCTGGHNSSGMQVSVYTANQTCNPSGCVVQANPVNDEDITLGWNATPGETYLITFDGYGGQTCTMNFAITDIVTTILLPIELISFNAFYREKEVVLDWVTESETNNDYFTIEKSRDGENFVFVKNVKGAGNSSATKSYITKDDQPFEGVSYYRLKQTDYDGKYEYSDLVPVSVKSSNEGFIVYPNPASNKAEISFNANGDEEAVLNIISATGSLVLSKKVNAKEGVNSVNLDIHNLSKGIYFVTITNKHKVLKTKFIKE